MSSRFRPNLVLITDDLITERMDELKEAWRWMRDHHMNITDNMKHTFASTYGFALEDMIMWELPQDMIEPDAWKWMQLSDEQKEQANKLKAC